MAPFGCFINPANCEAFLELPSRLDGCHTHLAKFRLLKSDHWSFKINGFQNPPENLTSLSHHWILCTKFAPCKILDETHDILPRLDHRTSSCGSCRNASKLGRTCEEEHPSTEIGIRQIRIHQKKHHVNSISWICWVENTQLVNHLNPSKSLLILCIHQHQDVAASSSTKSGPRACATWWDGTKNTHIPSIYGSML